MTQATQRTLVESAQRGDETALRALFDRSHQAVMSFCLLSTRGDRDAAKDLAQETFTRAFKYLDTLEEPDRFKPWLFTIAANVCRRVGKKESRYRRALDAFASEHTAQVPPQSEVERTHNAETVRRLIESIENGTLKEIVRLKYTSPGHTTQEIAKRLNIPHGTVTVKLMRFRAELKRTMMLELLKIGSC